MKNAFTAIALAAALFLAVSDARADAGAIRRFAVVLDSGAAVIGESGFGSGLKYGGGVFFRTGHRMGVEIVLERFSVPLALGAAGLPSAGRMTMTSLLINEQLFVLTEGWVLPYALAGIGFAHLGYAPEAWPGDLPRRDFVDRLALQLGGGLDFPVTRGLALCVKARYNLVKTWVEVLPRVGPIRDVDPLAQNMLHIYGLELALGVKVSF